MNILVWFLPGLVVLLPGLRTLSFDFAYDDWWAVLGVEKMASSPRDFISLRRPLKVLSFLVDRVLFDSDPAGYHMHSVLWATVAAVLVAFLARRLSGSPRLGLVAGLLFAVHPVHVEAVANIASRKDLMATTLSVAALLIALGREGRLEVSTAHRGKLIAAAGFFLASLLCKEVVAGGVLLFGLAWVISGPRIAGLGGQDIRPWLVGTAVISGVALLWYYVPDPGKMFTPEHLARLSEDRVLSMGSWASHGLAGAFRSLGMIILPVSLCADYGLPAEVWLLAAQAILGALLLSGSIVGGLLVRSRRPLVAFGLLWTPLTLLPVSNLLPLSRFFVADRYLYAPSMGMSLMVALLLEFAWQRKASPMVRKAAVIVLMALLVAGFVMTGLRLEIWRDDESLWLATLQENPGSFRAHNNLGKIHLDRMEFARAVRYYQDALPLASSRARATVICDLGAAHLGQKQVYQAVTVLREGVHLNPGSPHCRFNLGSALLASGQSAEGLNLMEEATRSAPGIRSLSINLIRIYGSLNSTCRAEELCVEVLEAKQKYPADVAQLCQAVRSQCR